MTSSLKLFFPIYFKSLLYKTNRFQVAVHLFSNRSQRNGGTNQRFNGRINVFIEAKRGKEEKKEGEEVTEGE